MKKGGGGRLWGREGEAVARERPAPARRPARAVVRDPPARARVRGARRGVPVRSRRRDRDNGTPRVGPAPESAGAGDPLTGHDETTAVRGAEPVGLRVRETRHGPILDTAPVGVVGDVFEPLEETIALRWTAADGLLEPSALIDLARAA